MKSPSNTFHLVRFTEKNAVEMLELFLECMPEYNIDRPDGDGKFDIFPVTN